MTQAPVSPNTNNTLAPNTVPLEDIPELLLRLINNGELISRDDLDKIRRGHRDALKNADLLVRILLLRMGRPDIFACPNDVTNWILEIVRQTPRDVQSTVLAQAFTELTSGVGKENLPSDIVHLCASLLNGVGAVDLPAVLEKIRACIQQQSNTNQSISSGFEKKFPTNGQALKYITDLFGQKQLQKEEEDSNIVRCIENIQRSITALYRCQQKKIDLENKGKSLRKAQEDNDAALEQEEQKEERLKSEIKDEAATQILYASVSADIAADISALTLKQEVLQKKDDEHKRNVKDLAENKSVGTEQLVNILTELDCHLCTLQIVIERQMTGTHFVRWPLQRMLDSGVPISDALKINYFKRKLRSNFSGEIKEEFWSVEDVGRWLMPLERGRNAVSHFQKANIGGTALLQLAEDDCLELLGVQNCLEQDEIMDAVEKLPGRYMLVPKEFFCPLTKEIMVEPVTASDNHNYEREAINNYIRLGLRKSPVDTESEEALTNELIPNRPLKERIRKFVAARDSASQA